LDLVSNQIGIQGNKSTGCFITRCVQRAVKISFYFSHHDFSTGSASLYKIMQHFIGSFVLSGEYKSSLVAGTKGWQLRGICIFAIRFLNLHVHYQ